MEKRIKRKSSQKTRRAVLAGALAVSLVFGSLVTNGWMPAYAEDTLSALGLSHKGKTATQKLTAKNDGCTVTVSYDEKMDIPVGAELQIREILPDEDGYTGYKESAAEKLSADNNKEETIFFERYFDLSISAEDGTVNLEEPVTVEFAFDEAQPLTAEQTVSVFRFAKDGAEVLEVQPTFSKDGMETVSFGSDSLSACGIVGTEEMKAPAVSGKGSITFKIQSFSVITVETLAEAIPDKMIIDGNEFVKSTNSLDLKDFNANTANEWEVSTAGYYTDINGARLIKTIEPTDIENVFEVNVIFEREITNEIIEDVFKTLPGQEIDQNSAGIDQANEGDVINPDGWHNGDDNLSANDKDAINKNTYVNVTYEYKDKNGSNQTIGPIKMYPTISGKSGKHHGIVQILPNGEWLVIDNESFKWGDSVTATLTYDQYIELVKNLIPKIKNSGITDLLDTSRFIYLGTELTNNKTASETLPRVNYGKIESYNSDTGKIIWKELENLDINTSAMMTYYVRLKTSKLDGADSNIEPMTFNSKPIVNTGGIYFLGKENITADLTANFTKYNGNEGYTTTSVELTENVSQPSVKGLLYYIQVKKVSDSTMSTGLPNAVFSVFEGNNDEGSVMTTITTGEDGIGLSEALPWGEYYIKETSPPAGYSISDNNTVTGSYRIAYLGDSQGSWNADTLSERFSGKDLSNTPFIDSSSKLTFVAYKTNDNQDEYLDGAEFQITNPENDVIKKIQVKTGLY